MLRNQTKKDQHEKGDTFLGAFVEVHTPAYKKRVVIAIDFGSTHCGIAYALVNQIAGAEFTPENFDYRTALEKPEILAKIYKSKYTKQPTCALFSKTEEQIVNFGFEARERYLDMVANEDAEGLENLLYFEGRNIKMRLWDSVLNFDITVDTVDGKFELSLKRVIAGILGHLKKEALALASTGLETVLEAEDALWVLTVPSIWQEADKQFMRKAAHAAKLISTPESTDLILALEPECAIIAASEALKGFKKGDKVLTLDCGGGTVDVCCVEVIESQFVPAPKAKEKDLTLDEKYFDGSKSKEQPNSIKNQYIKNGHLRLRQLIEPTGGNWGSTFIDANFMSFLSYFLKDPRLETARSKDPGSVLELLTEFEAIKTGITAKDYKEQKGQRSINLANVLHALNSNISEGDFEDVYDVDRQEVIHRPKTKRILKDLVSEYNKHCEENSNGFGGLSLQGRAGNETNLVIPMTLIVTFFKPVIDKILNELEEIIMLDELTENVEKQQTGLNYVLLVGGFAECEVLKAEVKKRLRKRAKLLIPKHPASVVQKGAVEYGFDPNIISTRRVRQTIGIKVTMLLEDVIQLNSQYKEKLEVDTDKHKVFDSKSKKYLVHDVFNAYIRKGEEIETTHVITREFKAPEKKGKVKFHIYATDGKEPLFVTDAGCIRLATLQIPIEPQSDPLLECRMRFASTEISATVVNLSTKESKELLLQYNNLGLSGAEVNGQGSSSTFVRVPVKELQPWGDMEFEALEMSEML